MYIVSYIGEGVFFMYVFFILIYNIEQIFLWAININQSKSITKSRQWVKYKWTNLD